MLNMKPARYLMMAVALGLVAQSARAEEAAASAAVDNAPYGSARGLAISGDMGYYTYGMDDVNSRFKEGGNNEIHGGLGYGGAVKLGLTDHLAIKVGMDYLVANKDSARLVGSTTYTTQVSLPATMLYIGGEYVILPLQIMNVKLMGGYTMVNIFDGKEKGTGNNTLDFGSVTGSGSGFQVGVGTEVFLARGFSLEADLGYNYAKITNATFAGSAADPGSVDKNGAVDYSGLVAKVAFNIYLFR